MKTCIGSCSLCGGQVTQYTGPWMSVLPPPPPSCEVCQAVPRAHVVDMVPRLGTYQTNTANKRGSW